jgi:DNA-binding NarL/FixJ family response regulator
VTRVAIVAATRSVRAQLESAVGRSASHTVSATATSLDAIARDTGLASSEVLLLHGSATDFGARELEPLPPIPIIALLRDGTGGAGARLLGTGIRGILPDDSTPEEIAAAIEAVVAGLVVLPPEQIGDLVGQRSPLPRDPARPRLGTSRPASLTPREHEILGMLADGLPNKVIASRLGISDHTVKTHLEAVFDKLGASTRAEAVARAVRAGLLLL